MKKSKIGNRSKYKDWLTDDGLLRVEGWARDGLTDVQIAKNIGISIATLYNWKNVHTEFLEAIKKGRAPLAEELVNQLIQQARGYSYEETKVEIMADGTKKGTQYTRYSRPDTTAIIFALKRLKPEVYGDHAGEATPESTKEKMQNYRAALNPTDSDIAGLWEDQTDSESGSEQE